MEFLQSTNNYDNVDIYRIIIDEEVNRIGSNLAKEIVLIHELIHAYLFDALHEEGLITFPSNDEIILNATCYNTNFTNVTTI